MTTARILMVLLLLMSFIPLPGQGVTYTVSEAWNKNLNGEEVRTVDISEDLTHAVAGTDANKVFLYTTGGSEVWNKTLNASFPLDKVNQTIFIDNTYFLAISNKTVYIIKTDGTFLLNATNASQNYPVVSAAATITGNILAYCTPEYLYVYNITTGALKGSWEPHTTTADHWRGVAIKEDGSAVYGLSSGGAIEAYSRYQIPSTSPSNTTKTFTASGNLTIPVDDTHVEAWLVGGGGAGYQAGGGGGYTMLYSFSVVSGDAWIITVGGGGYVNGHGGNRTRIENTTMTMSAAGGAGADQPNPHNGGNGGSGGGGYGGGNGGSNGADGTDGTDGTKGTGQVNTTYEFHDTGLTLYSGGGGGSKTLGLGGAGGGGNGGVDGVSCGVAGTTNLGGGGGGGFNGGYCPGAGGAGIVKVRNITAGTPSGQHFNYTSSKTGLTAPQSMKLDATESWFSVSTTGTWYAQHVTGGSTFDTQYSYASASGAPTAPTKISSGGSFGIEGRGSGIIDILRLDGTRVGTYTAGGVINSLDMTDNGLWAVAGSTDENLYIFGKASSSSWTLQATETPSGQIKAVRIRTGSTVILAGGIGGVFAYYTITEGATTGPTTFWVGKDGQPYTNKLITIEDCGLDGATCTALYSGVTDSFGTYSASLTFGHYYEVSVNSGEKVVTVLSTSNLLQYNIVITTTPPVPLNYLSWYNATNASIYALYTPNTAADTLTVTITRLSDMTNVYTNTPALGTSPWLLQYDVSGGRQNSSYRVTMDADDGSHTGTGTWVFTVVNASSGAGPGMMLPAGLDSFVKMAIGFLLALIIGGVFSYVSGPVGAFITSIACGGLMFLGLFPLSWTGAITLMLVWSVLGLIGAGNR